MKTQTIETILNRVQVGEMTRAEAKQALLEAILAAIKGCKTIDEVKQVLRGLFA